MFLANVPAYVIDLADHEPLRWTEVIARETVVASQLVQETGAAFERVPELIRSIFARLYQALGDSTEASSNRGRKRSVYPLAR